MSIPQTFPVIRLEVDRLRVSILHAFSEQALSLDEDIRAAVEAFCQEENIKGIIDRQVAQVIDNAIREEIEKFYRYGKGRAVIREAIDEVMR